MTTHQPLMIFDAGAARVEVRLEGDSLWLNLQQLAELFERDKSVISRHLKNIFKEAELERHSVVAKNATTATDGKSYQVEYYNLDAIISVGYRVNSSRATRFRQWATQVLREHLTQGYSLDRQRFERNATELEAALELVRKAAAGEALTSDQGRGLVDVITRIGAYLLVDFLARNGRLFRAGTPVINDVGLAALALLMAESDPKAKDIMIRLIETMLSPIPT